MNLTEEPGVTIVSLLLRACIGLAVLSVVLPALSWAEPLVDSSSSGVGNRTDLRVTVAEETEAIAARTMGRTGDPQQVGSEGRAAFRPEEGFRSGTWHLGLIGGYSISHKIFAPRAVDVQFAPLLGQIGYTVTDVHGPFPVRGSLELILEPILLVTTTPSTTFGQGASLILRYNFATGTRWVPFLDFGMGILHWNLRLPTILGTQFNFTLQAGPGLHYFVTDRVAITGQARLHHISNGGIDSPNIGVNSSVYLLGISYFF